MRLSDVLKEGNKRVHSDLSHWLPSRPADSEVMQSTAHFHYKVTHSLLCEANGFFDHAAPFDAAVDMLDAHSTLRDQAIGCLLLGRELYSTRFFGRHDGLYSLEGESLKLDVQVFIV